MKVGGKMLANKFKDSDSYLKLVSANTGVGMTIRGKGGAEKRMNV
jgi:hypothetical protein